MAADRPERPGGAVIWRKRESRTKTLSLLHPVQWWRNRHTVWLPGGRYCLPGPLIIGRGVRLVGQKKPEGGSGDTPEQTTETSNGSGARTNECATNEGRANQ